MATFRPKENARPEFLLMVMESWTYNRMTVDEKSTCLDKIITATIKGRFLQRWTQLQAVFSAYLDAIGYSGAGWRDAQNAHTEPETIEGKEDTTSAETEPQEGTETAQKTTDMATFCAAYRAAYTALYDHCGEPETDEKERYYSALFDQEAEAIADIIRRFCVYRGDLLTSDREAAAFMIALEAVGTPTDGKTATDGETTTTTETKPQRATETAGTTTGGKSITTPTEGTQEGTQTAGTSKAAETTTPPHTEPPRAAERAAGSVSQSDRRTRPAAPQSHGTTKGIQRNHRPQKTAYRVIQSALHIPAADHRRRVATSRGSPKICIFWE